MTKVTFDITLSLDGFITGPNPSPEAGLGEGGERLHEWAYELKAFHEAHGREGGETGTDNDVLGEMFDNLGAVLIGRRMFDHAEEAWGDSPPFGCPVFVLTHRERPDLPKEGGTTFYFVTEGVETAVERAREAAGDGNVSVGGGETIQQCLRAGLIDEFHLHFAPMLLGRGTPLFGELGREIDVECIGVIESSKVTHMRYRVLK